MELLYKGKTKDVYRLADGTIELRFKDDVTGEDGVFDPGADTVGLTLSGAGKSGLLVTTYFFELLDKENIRTHYVETDEHNVTMRVKEAEMFGEGLEVICRYRAVGSFYRRYGAYCEEGAELNGIVEMTIKDDERGDPPISQEALAALRILTADEYVEIVAETKKVCSIIKDALAKENLELYDIKLEFGRDKQTKELMLIDEISGGNMRVADREGNFLDPFELEDIIITRG